MYRQPQYIFSSRGRSHVYFNTLAICGTLTSFINRTVCRAPLLCFTSFGKKSKKRGKWRGALGGVLSGYFEWKSCWSCSLLRKDGQHLKLHLTPVQPILVLFKPKTSSVCSPEGWQNYLKKDCLLLNCQATSNPSGNSKYIGLFKIQSCILCAL